MGGETSAMQTLLTDLGTVVTQVLDWTVESATTITQNPLLLMTTGILMLGGAIGILGRLLRRG